VKEYLSQKGVSYIERDVSVDRAAANELVRLTRQMAVPVTVIDGQTIVGFDRGRLEQVLAEKSRPSLGAAVADVARTAAARGQPAASGAYVGRVKPDSTAHRMGLAAGDIIVEVNSQPVTTAEDLERIVTSLRPASRIRVVFLRSGSRQAVDGTL
jgi:glutaredoxin 3